jgi:hypothetical protein
VIGGEADRAYGRPDSEAQLGIQDGSLVGLNGRMAVLSAEMAKPEQG